MSCRHKKITIAEQLTYKHDSSNCRRYYKFKSLNMLHTDYIKEIFKKKSSDKVKMAWKINTLETSPLHYINQVSPKSVTKYGR
jgi:hypothetical protein